MASVFNAVDSISAELATIIQSEAPDEISVTEKEAKIEELMEMNQGLLQCTGVSHASIILRTTLKYKLASKLTGAGGGGCVLTLLPTLLSATVVDKVTAELELCGFHCLTAAIGGQGVQVCFGGHPENYGTTNQKWHSLTHSHMEKDSDYGAFTEKFLLQPSSSSHDLPLSGLTFAVKDIFDMAGYVTGFGNPDWARTHPAAKSTAPSVSTILEGGATCIGRTIMDEMAYSINGENNHYGTPVNPCAPDRVPGGSSSGSAVVVAAGLADFSLGTDSGGSVRVPASYCGIFGFRPSHGVISTSGVVPLAQSFDTVGWFARDPVVLSRVGRALLQIPDAHPVRSAQLIIAEDCFQLSSIPSDRVKQGLVHSVEKLFGGHVLKHANLGDVVKDKVPSLNCFFQKGNTSQEDNIPSLAALSSAMRTLERHEFKNNHGEWVSTVRPDIGPADRINERIWEAVRATDENINICHSVKTEFCAALTELLGDAGVLAIPTVPGLPPKLHTDPATLETYRHRAFSFLSIAVVSGFCQVVIPLGMYEGLPVSVSLLAKHGSDGFLLSLVETLYATLKEQVGSLK